VSWGAAFNKIAFAFHDFKFFLNSCTLPKKFSLSFSCAAVFCLKKRAALVLFYFFAAAY
jgi:hypothetical protein